MTMMMSKDLSGVYSLSTGQQAILRREAGKRIHDADAKALQAFYKAMPYGVPQCYHERYYAVMCMMCIWRANDKKNSRQFAECLRIASKDSNGIDKKMRILLDTTFNGNEDYYFVKLARLVRQVHSINPSLYPDFEELLQNVMDWDSQSRKVQRKWTEIFIMGTKSTQNNKENNKNIKETK